VGGLIYFQNKVGWGYVTLAVRAGCYQIATIHKIMAIYLGALMQKEV
jgi:hypothetical protein